MRLIIGGGSGIGLSFRKYAMSEGRMETWVSPTQHELDVLDPEALEEFFSSHNHTHITQLVFAAGVNYLEWLGKGDFEEYTKVLDTNLKGFIYVLDLLRKYNSCAVDVLVVGSDAAERPLRTSIAYCASKAGLHMAVRVAARELGPLGWRVNAVAPGMTDKTGMQEYVDERVQEVRNWSYKAMRQYEDSQAVVPGRIRVREVAEVMYSTLNGPKHLNGSIIMINGGR